MTEGRAEREVHPVDAVSAPQAVLVKDEAICLCVRPFSKTSQMVTWFAREYGLITTPVKGAQRPKSGFVGRYDVGYTCEIVFYAHSRSGGTHHIRECSPLALREALRTHWRSATAAAYGCDLTLRATRPGLPNPTLFQTLEDFLDVLPTAAAREVPLLLLWMESNLLLHLGVAPDFTPCPRCAPSPNATFSVEEGHFCCDHRPSRLPKPLTLSLHREIPELFVQFTRESIAQTLERARASQRTDFFGRPEPFPGVFGLRRFLGIFLNLHLDLLPGPRRTALDLLI